MSFFADKTLKENGRIREITDENFLILYSMWKDENEDIKQIMKKDVFSRIDENLLDQTNQEKLKEIKEYIRPHKIVDYVKSKIDQIENIRIKDMKGDENRKLNFYRTFYNACKEENLNWAIYKLVEYSIISNRCSTSDNVSELAYARNLYFKMDLHEFLTPNKIEQVRIALGE